MNLDDIIKLAREAQERQSTHSEYCWRWHHECALRKFFNLPPLNVEKPAQPDHMPLFDDWDKDWQK